VGRWGRGEPRTSLVRVPQKHSRPGKPSRCLTRYDPRGTELTHRLLQTAVSALVVLVAGARAQAQLRLGPSTAPFPNASAIIEAIGSDEAAASVVSQSLTDWLRVTPNATPIVVDAQIPARWRPALPDVRFTEVTEEAARALVARCARLLVVHRVTRTGDTASVSVGEMWKCGGSGIEDTFRQTADGWRPPEPPGTSGGFVSGVECSCR
jgi:hypothetical protein